MARTGITYEQATAAIDSILGQGKEPTIAGIREALGTGSPNTIHKYLNIWRTTRPKSVAASVEIPSSLSTAIAAEIERAAAQARAQIEEKLVQAQQEAAELSNVGELLESERDDLTDEKQTEQIKREQQAAESARVEVATARLKIESMVEKQVEQTSEIGRLRDALSISQKAQQQAEQNAAVGVAKLEAMTDKVEKSEAYAAKLDARGEQLEKQIQQLTTEINSFRNQVTAHQQALDTSARENDKLRGQVTELKTETKRASETANSLTAEAAELRGRLAAITGKS